MFINKQIIESIHQELDQVNQSISQSIFFLQNLRCVQLNNDYLTPTLANASTLAEFSISKSAVFMLPYFAAICSGV